MKALKKIWDVLTTLIVVLIVLTAVALIGSRIAGLQHCPSCETGCAGIHGSDSCRKERVG